MGKNCRAGQHFLGNTYYRQIENFIGMRAQVYHPQDMDAGPAITTFEKSVEKLKTAGKLEFTFALDFKTKHLAFIIIPLYGPRLLKDLWEVFRRNSLKKGARPEPHHKPSNGE